MKIAAAPPLCYLNHKLHGIIENGLSDSNTKKAVKNMMRRKIPYGISNYKKIIKEQYMYVDKTRFIEILESLNFTNLCECN